MVRTGSGQGKSIDRARARGLKHGGIVAVLLLSGAIIVGCGKKDSGEDPSASPTGTPAGTVKPNTQPVTTVVQPPVNHEADANSVRVCCSALRSAAAAQSSTTEKSKFESAAAACDGIAVVVRNGASNRQSAMSQIRAALRGGTPPAGCN